MHTYIYIYVYATWRAAAPRPRRPLRQGLAACGSLGRWWDAAGGGCSTVAEAVPDAAWSLSAFGVRQLGPSPELGLTRAGKSISADLKSCGPVITP